MGGYSEIGYLLTNQPTHIYQRRYDNITCVDYGISINSSKSIVGVVCTITATPTTASLLHVN